MSVNEILKHVPEFIQTSVHLFQCGMICATGVVSVRLVPVCVSESESYCTSLVTFSVALASCCPMVAVSMAIGLAAEQRGNAQSALCSHTSQDFKQPTAFEAIIHNFSPLFANLVIPNVMQKLFCVCLEIFMHLWNFSSSCLFCTVGFSFADSVNGRFILML